MGSLHRDYTVRSYYSTYNWLYVTAMAPTLAGRRTVGSYARTSTILVLAWLGVGTYSPNSFIVSNQSSST